MRAGPVLLELIGQPFGNQVDGKARSIGGDDGAGSAELRNLGKQVALDVQIFRDYFDDPIGLRAMRQIVFEISNRDFLRKRSAEECPGRDFLAASTPLRAKRFRSEASAPGLRSGGTISSSTQGRPALAKCAAMRAPMVPAPKTTAFWIASFMNDLRDRYGRLDRLQDLYLTNPELERLQNRQSAVKPQHR